MAALTEIADYWHGQIGNTTSGQEEWRLSRKISSTATSLIMNFKPLDENDAAITKNFFISTTNSDGTTEVMRVTAAASSTITVVRGIARGGIDFAGAAGNAVAHSAGQVAKCISYSGVIQMLVDCLQGDIGSTIKFNDPTTFMGDGILRSRVFADATARDAAITSPSNGDECYLTDTGKKQDYIGGSWIDRESGGTFPNASTTVAGKVEIATDAEVDAGTETGGTGAKLVATPDQVADVIQEAKYIFAADGEASDTYAITLVPAIDAYVTGQSFYFTANTANTGAATLNVNAKGAKNILKFNDQALEDGDIEAGSAVHVIYDGTSMQLQTPVATQMSTADSATLTDASNADALHTHTIGGGVGVGNGTASASGAFTVNTLSFTPRLIQIHYRYTDNSGNVDTVGNGQADATDNEQSMWHQDSNAGTASGVSASVILSPGNLDADTWSGDLSAISSSGFTITLTKTNNPGNVSIHWTAFA